MPWTGPWKGPWAYGCEFKLGTLTVENNLEKEKRIKIDQKRIKKICQLSLGSKNEKRCKEASKQAGRQASKQGSKEARKQGSKEARKEGRKGRRETLCPNFGFELQNVTYTMPSERFQVQNVANERKGRREGGNEGEEGKKEIPCKL